MDFFFLLYINILLNSVALNLENERVHSIVYRSTF